MDISGEGGGIILPTTLNSVILGGKYNHLKNGNRDNLTIQRTRA
jgi:hypothetical protein